VWDLIFTREHEHEFPVSAWEMRVLYTFGLNEDGQCGVPQKDEHNGCYLPVPVHFPARVNIATVSLGSRHSLALSDAGELFSWGWGHLGQLGHGDCKSSSSPRRVEFFHNRARVIHISAGGVHSGCIDNDNRVYTWGKNTNGQLGLGSSEIRFAPLPSLVKLPTQAGDDADVPLLGSSLSCGGLHTALVDLQGSVYCWGKADSGQTGYRDWYLLLSSQLFCPHLVSHGSLFPPLVMGRALRAAEVSCGGFHTMILMEDGSVYGERWCSTQCTVQSMPSATLLLYLTYAFLPFHLPLPLPLSLCMFLPRCPTPLQPWANRTSACLGD
jgi:alpha-tubulin suppressor-like RCC1 family protein